MHSLVRAFFLSGKPCPPACEPGVKTCLPPHCGTETDETGHSPLRQDCTPCRRRFFGTRPCGAAFVRTQSCPEHRRGCSPSSDRERNYSRRWRKLGGKIQRTSISRLPFSNSCMMARSAASKRSAKRGRRHCHALSLSIHKPACGMRSGKPFTCAQRMRASSWRLSGCWPSFSKLVRGFRPSCLRPAARSFHVAADVSRR